MSPIWRQDWGGLVPLAVRQIRFASAFVEANRVYLQVAIAVGGEYDRRRARPTCQRGHQQERERCNAEPGIQRPFYHLVHGASPEIAEAKYEKPYLIFDMGNLSNARLLKVIFRRNDDAQGVAPTLRKDVLDERGVTLLEVIIATALLGIAVVGLVGALSAALRVSLTIEEQTAAAGLATRCMEEALANVAYPAETCAAERTGVEELCDSGIYSFPALVTSSESKTPGVKVFRCGEQEPVFAIPTPDISLSPPNEGP